MKPIGIFGGTFDPIHNGHLRLAQELAVSLALKEVRFIPAGRPPHRASPAVSSEQRLEMVRLAIADNPLFAVDEREIHKLEPCYTVNTLQELRLALGAEQPLCLLMGADQFMGLISWHDWQTLFELAHIVVAHRPGFPQISWADSLPDALQQALKQRQVTDVHALHETPYGGILTQAITPLDISATYIRHSLQTGGSPRYLLPDVVLDYIQTHQLYI